MYIRPIFRLTDQAKLVAFMQRYSFATLITATGQMPIATHLPLLVATPGDELRLVGHELRLVGHMARANPQWHELEAHSVLVVFSGPYAYISPTHYEQQRSVPTWNYLAVHATGRARLVTEPARVLEIMAATIAQYEPGYQPQWERMPPDFQAGLLQGIVAFELTITDLQGQQKLSQNKTAGEQQRIREALAGSPDQHACEVAAYMRASQQTAAR
ncbi:MAG: FMN-binding negative transcriptional regulator [Janthinobacterium lividum]